MSGSGSGYIRIQVLDRFAVSNEIGYKVHILRISTFARFR
jgi:hypothetical protein